MIRRSGSVTLGVVLLLSACSPAPGSPAVAAPSPSAQRDQVVTVYAGAPRPKALELPVMRVLGEQEANLRWPKAGLHLDMIGAAPAVDPLVGTPAPVRVDGTEFVIAHVGAPPQGATWREISDAVVRVAGTPHAVTTFARDSFIVVRAPKDAIVRLEVTDTGRMQWIDLRTAETGNLIKGYYPVRHDGASISCKVSSATKAVDGSTFVLMTQAAVEPWTEGRGWAPAGRMWLIVRFRVWYSRNVADVSLDGPASVALSYPGTSLPVPRALTVSDDPLTVTYDAPADLTVAQVAFSAKGAITVGTDVVPAWSSTCETVPDALTFQ